ncbi:MAG: response regulator [Verrucomicrobiales bacterium]|nr:response regulator [Verrucomicrobiales bacterium]
MTGFFGFQRMADMEPCILVVDDSPVNRLVAETKLQEVGFQVESAEDGSQALELLKIDEPPDLPEFDAILLDVMMPEVDGIEVLEKVRQVWNGVQLPIIMATAKDQPEDILHALKLGANDYVTKPLDLPILMARLNVHLQLKESHAQLRRAQGALMSAARIESVGLLAAGVAHEIRNPLGRIQMAVGGIGALMASLPEEDQEMAQVMMDTISESVGSADEIVKGLMKASENTALPLEEADLNAVVKRGLDFLKPEIVETGATLTIDLDEDAPDVLVAEEEYQQALAAVVRNAIQAMKIEGGDDRVLRVRTEATKLNGVGPKEGGRSGNRPRDGDEVVAVYVEDTGPGMHKDDLESAYDAFFTTKATGAGTGLGLTVARKIVELHKGLIRIENREDVESGLRVSIFLKAKGGLLTHV